MKAVFFSKTSILKASGLLAGLFLSSITAFAAPSYSTTTLVPYDPTAPDSNFDSAVLGSNTTAYTVKTGADATNFYVDVAAQPLVGASVPQFSNIYIGGPNFSGLIVEVSNNRVSTYDAPGTYFSLAGTGYTFNLSTNDLSFSLPFSFLENDPLNIGFSKASPGDIIRVSYSQSFGYTFVGGSTYYPTNMRLGGQVVPNAVPEPSSWVVMALATVGIAAVGLRRRRMVTA